MTKMKTKKSVAKRFRFTGSGKIKRSKAYRGHILTKKSAKRKRRLRSSGLVNRADSNRVRKSLPYG